MIENKKTYKRKNMELLKIDEPKNKDKFYNIEETQMFKNFKKWEKENTQEAKQIQQEIEEELKGYENAN